jgi:antitoxin VapB
MITRLQEIDAKHEQMRALLAEANASAVWLRRPRNIAWFTAGLDSTIAAESETGVYSLFITPEKRFLYTDNIEATRLRAEDDVESLGFEVSEYPWHVGPPPMSVEHPSDHDGAIEARIAALRQVLNENEQQRYRDLGRDTSIALETAARAVRPGDTEYQIAARLDAACKARGGQAVVNLIGVDERINRFRHPLATGATVRQIAMLVVCMRRYGLIASATRFIHFGPIAPEVAERFEKVAAIDAAVIAASRPGRTLGEIFADLQAAYAAQDEGDQWRLHHQGGTTGYSGREHFARPGDTITLLAGQACAWNPSIVGAKSEDTILIGQDGFEFLTRASADWPQIEVASGGRVISRPSILAL